MISFLLLGFLIGMKHAMEADHVAVVASLATGSRSVRQVVKTGVAWGLGHTLTLGAVAGAVLVLDIALPERFALIVEFAVGVMVVALGVDVLVRLIRERLHFHAHRHENGIVHIHAHAHAGEGPHELARHDHEHASGLPLRGFLVGLVHGLAGSAALLLLTLETIHSTALGLLYVGLFGLGSVLGMAALSVAIALPLRSAARGLTWAHNGLKASVGMATILLGVALIYDIAVARGLLL